MVYTSQTNTNETLAILLVILLLLAIWLCGPLISIWAVNTLFGTSIAYTMLNWFAALVLMGLLKGTCSSMSRDQDIGGSLWPS